MGNGFASIGTVINDDAVTAHAESFLSCCRGGGCEQDTEQIILAGSGIVNSWDAVFWDDQKMNRGLGRDISECDPFLALGDDVRRNFA